MTLRAILETLNRDAKTNEQIDGENVTVANLLEDLSDEQLEQEAEIDGGTITFPNPTIAMPRSIEVEQGQ